MKPKRSPKKTNVVGLRGAAPPVPQINDEVVAKLEDLLARAKSGGCSGLAYTAIDAFGHGVFGRCGNAEADAMISCTARLYYDMLADDRDAS